MTTKPILSIQGLTTSFETRAGVLRAVEDVSLDIYAGKTLGIVGESGCGKSVTCMSVLKLIPEPPGKIETGSILFRNGSREVDILKLPSKDLRRIRGREISMVFQEPMTSLNPVFTVGHQIGEVLELHLGMTRQESRKRSIEMLDQVRIPSAATRVDEYPHQLSGGMRQRVMIAMALACHPKVLIADEPTTALDVTIQAQILDLLRDLQKQLGMALILVTHDLGVVAQMADEVAVMYAGRVVETGPIAKVFKKPLHPYTRGLLESVPKRGQLKSIPGVVPNMLKLDPGCRFRERCEFADGACSVEPNLRTPFPSRTVRCVKDL